MSRKYPHVKQHDAMDCGAACLSMVARHHGRKYRLDELREMTYIDKQGVSLRGISDAAEKCGEREAEELPEPGREGGERGGLREGVKACVPCTYFIVQYFIRKIKFRIFQYSCHTTL